MRIVYMFVEGNTDRELILSLLEKRLGYKRYDNIQDMPQLLRIHVSKYPSDDGSIENKSKPAFVHSTDIGVMVVITNGKTNIPTEVKARLVAVDYLIETYNDQLSIVVIRDRDTEKDDQKIKNEMQEMMSREGITLKDDSIVFKEEYSYKMYVLPDSQEGAVEKIILDISLEKYPELTSEAASYRKTIEDNEKFAQYGKAKDISKEVQHFYGDKVQVGAITAVLKPDSSPAFMVRDKLITKNDISKISQKPEVRKLIDFLENL